MAVVTVIGICPQWASNWYVEGSVSHDGEQNTYLVQFHKEEPATCSCPAYRYSGDYGSQHCKHIELIRKHGCFYHPRRADFGEADWEDYGPIGSTPLRLMSTAGIDAGERCPGCAAPMIAERVLQ